MGVEELARKKVPGMLGTGLEPGVEQKAKERRLAMVGPVQPTIVNGIRPDGSSAMMPQVPMMATAPAPAAPSMQPTANPGVPTMQTAITPPVAMMAPPVQTYNNRVEGSALGMGSRPLGGGARPSGRSGMDPNRLAEREARRGNIGPLMQMRQQEMGQQFQRETFQMGQAAEERRDQRNFDQGLQMFDLQQQAETAQDAREWQQGTQMFERGVQQRATESAQERAQRLADQLAEEKRNSIVGYENMPTPDGKGYVSVGRTQGGTLRPASGYMPNEQEAGFKMMPIPGTQDSVITQGGRPVSGLPMFTQENPPPDGMGPTRTVPKPQRQEAPVIKNMLENGVQVSVQWDPDRGQWIRAKIVDADGDGQPDVPAGAKGTPPAQTSSGVKFKIK